MCWLTVEQQFNPAFAIALAVVANCKRQDREYYKNEGNNKSLMKLLLLIGLTLIIQNLASAQVSNDPFIEYIYEIDSINNRKLHLNADIMPTFVDTNLTFNKFFSRNFRYPSTECLQTKIVISFVVEANSEISNKKIINKLNCDISKEVMLVLDSLPRMKPGLIHGKAVPVKLTYPIMVELR